MLTQSKCCKDNTLGSKGIKILISFYVQKSKCIRLKQIQKKIVVNRIIRKSVWLSICINNTWNIYRLLIGIIKYSGL